MCDNEQHDSLVDDSNWGDLFPSDEDERDNEIAELSKQLAHEKDSKLEERFGWIVALVALVNYELLKEVSSLSVPLVVFFFQLISLLILAKKLGIDYVATLISKTIGSVSKKIEK